MYPRFSFQPLRQLPYMVISQSCTARASGTPTYRMAVMCSRHVSKEPAAIITIHGITVVLYRAGGQDAHVIHCAVYPRLSVSPLTIITIYGNTLVLYRGRPGRPCFSTVRQSQHHESRALIKHFAIITIYSNPAVPYRTVISFTVPLCKEGTVTRNASVVSYLIRPYVTCNAGLVSTSEMRNSSQQHTQIN
jgi:hypothetical protein